MADNRPIYGPYLAPTYTPSSGYGTQINGYNYVQTSPNGGAWSTTPQTPVPGSVLGASTSSGGGGGGGGQPSQPQEDPNAALYRQIDEMYNSTLSYLGGQESKIKESQGTAEQGVQEQYAASQKSLESERASGERGISEAEVTASGAKEDALTASRRLYNELTQSGQQRFGGASSAGEAYSELTGREFQRNQATAQKSYQEAVMKINNMKQDLNERYEAALFNLETQKNQALNDVRAQFQERLSQIDAMKYEAGQNKASMKLELLQNLRNQVYQLNLAAVSTQSQLQAQLQASNAELNAAMNGFNQNVSEANQAVGGINTNYETSYDVSQGGQQMAYTPTGAINRRDDELFV